MVRSLKATPTSTRLLQWPGKVSGRFSFLENDIKGSDAAAASAVVERLLWVPFLDLEASTTQAAFRVRVIVGVKYFNSVLIRQIQSTVTVSESFGTLPIPLCESPVFFRRPFECRGLRFKGVVVNGLVWLWWEDCRSIGMQGASAVVVAGLRRIGVLVGGGGFGAFRFLVRA